MIELQITILESESWNNTTPIVEKW